jgi:hypothetical protein
LDENSLTDFSQEDGIMTGEIRDSEVITSNPNIENMTDDQPNNMSRDQLQDLLNTVMQVIKESAKQTAALRRNLKNKRLCYSRNLKNKQPQRRKLKNKELC